MLNRIKILDFECKSNTTMGGEVFPRLICAKKQLDIRVQRTIKLCFFSEILRKAKRGLEFEQGRIHGSISRGRVGRSRKPQKVTL